jgi:hypothetical protein
MTIAKESHYLQYSTFEDIEGVHSNTLRSSPPPFLPCWLISKQQTTRLDDALSSLCHFALTHFFPFPFFYALFFFHSPTYARMVFRIRKAATVIGKVGAIALRRTHHHQLLEGMGLDRNLKKTSSRQIKRKAYKEEVIRILRREQPPLVEEGVLVL